MAAIKLANKRVYTFPVENPISGDDIPRLYVQRTLIVQEIRALKIGGGAGTFDWTARFDPDASMTGGGTVLHSDTNVSNNTTGVSYTPPFTTDPPIVPAGNWLWVELANVSTGLSRPVMTHIQIIGIESGA